VRSRDLAFAPSIKYDVTRRSRHFRGRKDLGKLGVGPVNRNADVEMCLSSSASTLPHVSHTDSVRHLETSVTGADDRWVTASHHCGSSLVFSSAIQPRA